MKCPQCDKHYQKLYPEGDRYVCSECHGGDESLTSVSSLPKGLARSLNEALEKTERLIKYIDSHIIPLSDSEWENTMIKWMESRGWENDRNDETTLGFSLTDTNGDKWIRDYNKKSRTFIHYNGSQKVTLKNNER